MVKKYKQLSPIGRKLLPNFSSLIDAKYLEFKAIDEKNAFERTADFLAQKTDAFKNAYRDIHKLKRDLSIYFRKSKQSRQMQMDLKPTDTGTQLAFDY